VRALPWSSFASAAVQVDLKRSEELAETPALRQRYHSGPLWQRCDTSGGLCAWISGATSAGHKITTAEAGHRLIVVVTAKNSAESRQVVVTAGNIGGGAPVNTGRAEDLRLTRSDTQLGELGKSVTVVRVTVQPRSTKSVQSVTDRESGKT
jgi:hypothetical protein